MILLLGGTGYIGNEFADVLLDRDMSFFTLGRDTYAKFTNLVETLRNPNIGLVINCAAFVTKPSVDLCEDHKAETLLGNLVFPNTLVNACELTQTPLLHISTGCVYNGDNGGKGWKETDPPQLSFRTQAGFYVGSKSLAEEVVSKYDKAWICRVRLPFDEFDNERNLLSKLQHYQKVYGKVYANLNSLAHRGDFVKACLDLATIQAPYGIYNCTNPGAIRTQEVCGMIKRFLNPELEFKYWDEEDFMRTIARTPKSNCLLNTDKLLATGVKIRTVAEAVEWSLRNWVKE